MKASWWALAVAGAGWLGLAEAHVASPIVVEIVGTDGRVFQEFPVPARVGAMRSYLQAEKGARYEIRVRNQTGQRLGLVIAVDGRNIINGRKSELGRDEPMYVLDAWTTQEYAGWRANLEAINEFYFTEWSDSYAEAFGDRSARGVIAVAAYREATPTPALAPLEDRAHDKSARRSESAGTGYGDRRIDPAVRVEFVSREYADGRHFIKYEWRSTLCRKRVIDCAEKNRFWDESTLGFAPPPPRR